MTPLIYLVLENDLKTIAGYPKWPNEILKKVVLNLLNLAG